MINSATDKAIPADTDKFAFMNSEDANKMVSLTWLEMKTLITNLTIMRNIWISVTGKAPGNLTLLDAVNWACQYSFIDAIKVTTASTNWDMWICETNAFDKALITTRQIAASRSGNYDISIAREYNSDGNNVYLIYTDNSGANNAAILVTGTQRRH